MNNIKNILIKVDFSCLGIFNFGSYWSDVQTSSEA
jgi:hypothetical protein